MDWLHYLFGWFLVSMSSVLPAQAQTTAGSVDAGFAPTPAPGWIEWLDVQADGAVVVLTNSASPFARDLPLLRFGENGERDPNYETPLLPYAASFLVDRSNRVVYAERPGPTTVRGIGRLLDNGVPDPSFSSGVMGGGTVETFLELPDGSLLIGGSFNQVNGQPRQSLARLTESGEVAADFNLTFNSTAASVWVHALLRQPDGRILIGGTFTNVNGFSRGGVARLNPDGTVDETFVPAGAGPSSAAAVYALGLQSDNRILVGGPFSRWGNEAIGQLVRLDANGSVDSTFVTTNRLLVVSGSTPAIERILVQEDDAIVISGRYSFAHGQPRSGLARLRPDGELDTEFNVEIRNQGQLITYLPTMDIAPGNKLMIGGAFTEVNGIGRTNIARILLSEDVGSLVIRITSLTLPEPGQVNIKFNTSAGGEFIVESSSDLSSWTAAGPNFTVPTAGDAEITVAQTSDQAQFFRVRSADNSGSPGN